MGISFGNLSARRANTFLEIIKLTLIWAAIERVRDLKTIYVCGLDFNSGAPMFRIKPEKKNGQIKARKAKSN